MRDEYDHDDPELLAMLRADSPAPPLDEVDWPALHLRITTRAEPLLSHAPASWWQLVAGWSGRGVPVAAAAAVLLLLGTGLFTQRPAGPSAVQQPVDETAGEAGMDATAFVTLEQDLASSSPAFRVAAGGTDDVVDALLFQGTEE